MRQWLISKIPVWVLRYLVWRSWRLVCSGHPRYMFCIWADMELKWRKLQIDPGCKPVTRKPPVLGPENPVGIREWIGKDHRPYGSIMYKGVPFFYRPCFCDYTVGENCELCQPVGVLKRPAKESESCGYKDEPTEGLNKPVGDRITVWLYHSNVMSRIGEKTLLYGKVYDITEAGLVPYRGEKDGE